MNRAQGKEIIKQHTGMLANLHEMAEAFDAIIAEVRLQTEALQQEAAENILKEIPVDELNRDKKGIRVKALRDCGFESIYDVIKTDPARLEAVDGIGVDSAKFIKKQAAGIEKQTAKSATIRLNADDRTPKKEKLVLALYKSQIIRPIAGECAELLKKNEASIQTANGDIEVVGGFFSGLFASKGKKTAADEAYSYLKELAEGDYGLRAEELYRAYKAAVGIWPAKAWDAFCENTIPFFGELEEIVPGIIGDDEFGRGLPEGLAKAIEKQQAAVGGLKCKLRRYQEWGVKYILHQERVLLGDEMGLGKTVQAIAAMVALADTGATHFVVVAPASVMTNWCREIAKHSDLSVIKVHGKDREKALFSWIQTGGVAVTTYETTGCFALDNAFRFCMLVVDEAHYIKNENAARSKNVRAICTHAKRILFMTGTALENKVDEMISLIAVLNPKLAAGIKTMAFMSTAPQFREKIAPVYYRRKREDVLQELPELIESVEWCTMTPEEEKVYEQTVLDKNYAAIRRVSWNVEDLEKSSKARRLKELVEEAEDDGRKVIVFSFFLDTIAKVCTLLGNRCTEPINGSVSPQRRQEIIDAFDAAPAGAVLPAQIQSGGTGLNIQSASVVIICEPQFKPSIENQAISRAYRMGQARNVLVYRLLCDETVDERILDMLSEKQAIFDTFADDSAAADESASLDAATFGDIVEEEIAKIKSQQSQS